MEQSFSSVPQDSRLSLSDRTEIWTQYATVNNGEYSLNIQFSNAIVAIYYSDISVALQER